MTNLKNKIQSGQIVLGTWNTFQSSLATKVLASSGIDFQIIDMEHGPLSFTNIHDHVAASNYFGCDCLVRIPTASSTMSLQALDQGASGIVVPQVENAESANKVVKDIKFFPEGDRGFSPFTFSGGFTNENAKEHVQRSNAESVIVLIIESLEALENIKQISEISSIDVIYIGAYDLSKAMGIPGDIFNPDLVKTIEKASSVINSSGKIAGSFVPQNKEQLKLCIDTGLKFITYSVDTFELKNSYRKALEDLDSII